MLADAGKKEGLTPPAMAELTMLFSIVEAIQAGDHARAQCLIADRLQQICWKASGDLDAAANAGIDQARILDTFLDDDLRSIPLTKEVLASKEPTPIYRVKANLVPTGTTKIVVAPKFLGGNPLKSVFFLSRPTPQ